MREDAFNIEVGARLRQVREQRRLSREKVSEMADISVQFLADVELGHKTMTLKTFSRLCRALCVSSDAVLFGEPTPERQMVQGLLRDRSEQDVLAGCEMLSSFYQIWDRKPRE